MVPWPRGGGDTVGDGRTAVSSTAGAATSARRDAEARGAATKRGVLRASVETRRQLLGRIAKLTAPERRRIYLGTWSAHEVVAHLIGWDYANERAAASLLRSRLPEFYAHHDRGWQKFNRLLVKRFGGEPTGRLIKKAAASHRRLMSVLDGVSERAFSLDRGIRFRGFKVTIRRLIEGETEDERRHLQQLFDEFGR